MFGMAMSGGWVSLNNAKGVIKNASILDARRPIQNATAIGNFGHWGEVVFIFWVTSSSFCGGSDLYLCVSDLEDLSCESEVGSRGLRVSITVLGKYICHRRQPK